MSAARWCWLWRQLGVGSGMWTARCWSWSRASVEGRWRGGAFAGCRQQYHGTVVGWWLVDCWRGIGGMLALGRRWDVSRSRCWRLWCQRWRRHTRGMVARTSGSQGKNGKNDNMKSFFLSRRPKAQTIFQNTNDHYRTLILDLWQSIISIPLKHISDFVSGGRK